MSSEAGETNRERYDPFRGVGTVTLRELLEALFDDRIDSEEIKGDPFSGPNALTVNSCLFADEDKPLHRVAWRGNPHCTRLLLEAGADPNGLGDLSMTPLHCALRGSGEACVMVARILLEAGARVDLIDEFDSSALGLCSRDGLHPNSEMFELLRSYWPDILPKDMQK